MMNNDTDIQRLALPKTKLFVTERRLIRHSPTNQTVSDIALNSITEVSVRMETDWPAIIFPIGLVVIAGACKWFIASPTLGWLLCISIAVVGLLSLLGLRRPMLRIQTRDGQVTFEIKDSFTEAEAFAVSLRQKLNEPHAV
jgi:hypothetical protein